MDTEDIRPLITDAVAKSLYEIISLRNEKNQMLKVHEKELDEVFKEFLSVLDTFEKSEAAIKERGLDQEENAQKAVKRVLNAKKKALSVLERFNVRKIEFGDGMVNDDFCTTVETEPDSSRKTGEIISIEKNGYTRNGHLIRRAEVVIVKN